MLQSTEAWTNRVLILTLAENQLDRPTFDRAHDRNGREINIDSVQEMAEVQALTFNVLNSLDDQMPIEGLQTTMVTQFGQE